MNWSSMPTTTKSATTGTTLSETTIVTTATTTASTTTQQTTGTSPSEITSATAVPTTATLLPTTSLSQTTESTVSTTKSSSGTTTETSTTYEPEEPTSEGTTTQLSTTKFSTSTQPSTSTSLLTSTITSPVTSEAITTVGSSTVITPTVTTVPTTSTAVSVCDNPKTIDYTSRNDEDVVILTTNNKPNQEAVNSLKGSNNKWIPADEGSGITYIVNRNNSAIFVDGTFTTVNVKTVVIDLLATNGKIITTETKSFVNEPDDLEKTFTLDFNMQEAGSLRISVTPKTTGTVPPSVSNVEIKVCYIPASTTTTIAVTTSGALSTTSAEETTTTISSATTPSSQPSTTGSQTTASTTVSTGITASSAAQTTGTKGTTVTTPSEVTTSAVPSATTPVSITTGIPSTTSTSAVTTVTVTVTTTVPEQCIFTKEEYMRNFGHEQEGLIGYIEKDGKIGLTSTDEEVRIGDTLETGTVVITANCSNCTCDSDGMIECKIGTCEVCTYTQWTEWTECSKSCDNGARFRNRTLTHFNPMCTTTVDEVEDCNVEPCLTSTTTPYCESWGEWSDCSSQNCDYGTRTRKRNCPGQTSEETDVCSEGCTSTTPICVHPKVYQTCQTCPGTCKAYRMNTCTEPEDCETGCGCPEGDVMDDNNNCIKKEECPCYNDNGVIIAENFTIPDTQNKCRECKCTMGNIECYDKPDCCDWTEWGSWGTCSKTCGNDGFKQRHRTLKHGDAGSCGTNMETELCPEPTPIPDACADCVIDGKPYKTGDVVGTSEDGCKTCTCTSYGTKLCLTNFAAIVHGSWTQWTQWSTCSKTCNGGERQRTRHCNDPAPSCGGNTCPGENTEVEPCSEEVTCCEISQWTEWGDCTVTCGEGSQLRTRNYKNSTDIVNCLPIEDKTDVKTCNLGNCECVYTPWTEWSTCTSPCGLGLKERTKELSPNNVNPNCNETITEETGCYIKDCICDKDHEKWTNYSYCQKTCENRHLPVSEKCSEVQQGCVCEDGYYLDYNNTCVKDCVCNTSAGIKQKNEQWTNPENKCQKCECFDTGVECYGQCEVVTEKDCQPGEVLVKIDDCCNKCEKQKDTCQKYTATEPIQRDGCVSVQNVTYDYCRGGCGDSTHKPLLLLENSAEMMSKDCSCCTGTGGAIQEVDVICEGRDGIVKAKIQRIDKCECKKCAVTEYEQQEQQASNAMTRRKR